MGQGTEVGPGVEVGVEASLVIGVAPDFCVPDDGFGLDRPQAGALGTLAVDLVE